MCSCEPGFTCSKCAGTPFDPRYHDDAHEPVDFDALIAESVTAEPFVPTPERWT